jgi:DNA polymerase IV
MEKIIFHIDVNNAFLAWTATELLKRNHHDIRDRLAVIGGSKESRRGVVLAKSISAKKKGITTGERIVNAINKVPNLEVYPPDFDLYNKMSNSLFKLISKYTPDIEVFSIDECFIDYTKVKKLYGEPLLFAQKLSNEIKTSLGFTVNIGIGNNKLCAKMASDFSKPDKIHTLFDDEVKEKLWPLPVGELLWIGKKSAIKLEELNIKTIQDLANADYTMLYKYFKNQTIKMIESANGKDDSIVNSNKWIPKGISNSTTFEKDLDKLEQIIPILSKLVENVALSLREQNKYANVVAVTIKDSCFKSYSHQRKLLNATNLTKEINDIAISLFKELWNKDPIRLVGVRLDHLVSNTNYQLSIFENIEKRNYDTKLDSTIDNLKRKFGDEIINPAIINNNEIKKKKMK